MLKNFTNKIERAATWFNLITGASLVGLSGWVSNYMASKTPWIVQIGPYGVLVATFFGIACALFLYALVVQVSVWRLRAEKQKKWENNTDSFNPLDKEFHKKRIYIQELAHPVDNKIVGKKFTECELIGPANIFFFQNTNSIAPHFINCDIIVVKPSNINNAIALTNIEFINCKFYRFSVFVSKGEVENLKNMAPIFITLTGNPAIDSLPPGKRQ
ncbi:hypothetical protein [Asticcacaulis endophyticus]|uniref:Uncharacterized protein n=1 Tax=Asticcacaulis endophyticus TaxID=1395890 RepID=A0A918Q5S2_9CAUL|nr:hypothetical protein [Asticcacaulis endophyticus]GGZ33816.1 hypothetical protein GCM10011273_20230 [Asticcacaulis endophyticus]